MPRSSPGETSISAIGKRDRWACHLCGLTVARAEASRDHVKPVSKGGKTTAWNLRLAHVSCNSARGVTPVHMARAEMRRACPPMTDEQKNAARGRALRASIFEAVQKGRPIAWPSRKTRGR